MLQLYAVAAIVGVGTVVFDIAYLAYVPTLAGRADLLEANTKLEVSHSGSYLAGPALAGGLIQLVGAAQAILADALSFLVSIATIAWIGPTNLIIRHDFKARPRPGAGAIGVVQHSHVHVREVHNAFRAIQVGFLAIA